MPPASLLSQSAITAGVVNNSRPHGGASQAQQRRRVLERTTSDVNGSRGPQNGAPRPGTAPGAGAPSSGGDGGGSGGDDDDDGGNDNDEDSREVAKEQCAAQGVTVYSGF